MRFSRVACSNIQTPGLVPDNFATYLRTYHSTFCLNQAPTQDAIARAATSDSISRTAVAPSTQKNALQSSDNVVKNLRGRDQPETYRDDDPRLSCFSGLQASHHKPRMLFVRADTRTRRTPTMMFLGLVCEYIDKCAPTPAKPIVSLHPSQQVLYNARYSKCISPPSSLSPLPWWA